MVVEKRSVLARLRSEVTFLRTGLAIPYRRDTGTERDMSIPYRITDRYRHLAACPSVIACRLNRSPVSTTCRR